MNAEISQGVVTARTELVGFDRDDARTGCTPNAHHQLVCLGDVQIEQVAMRGRISSRLQAD